MTTKNIPLFEEQYSYLMAKSMLKTFNLYFEDEIEKLVLTSIQNPSGKNNGQLFVLSKVGL